MNTSEPRNSYEKLSDKGIVGLMPNACTGPNQRIMPARCEGPTNLTTLPPGLAFYPGFSPTVQVSNIAPVSKIGVASAQTAQATLFYNLDGTVSTEPQK